MGAITGLATATASDRAAITQLTATFTRLMSELATVNKKLVSVLQASRISHGSRVGRDKTTRRREARAGVGARSGATTRTGTGPPTLTETAVGVDLDPLIHYCWTCGPRMQAQQFQMYQTGGRKYQLGHQEGHSGWDGSTAVSQER